MLCDGARLGRVSGMLYLMTVSSRKANPAEDGDVFGLADADGLGLDMARLLDQSGATELLASYRSGTARATAFFSKERSAICDLYIPPTGCPRRLGRSPNWGRLAVACSGSSRRGPATERFKRKPAPRLDPGWKPCSRQENASNQESGAPVSILSTLKGY